MKLTSTHRHRRDAARASTGHYCIIIIIFVSPSRRFGSAVILYVVRSTIGLLKPCPHYRRKVRLSQITARQWRQSHFSATVWTGFYH